MGSSPRYYSQRLSKRPCRWILSSLQQYRLSQTTARPTQQSCVRTSTAIRSCRVVISSSSFMSCAWYALNKAEIVRPMLSMYTTRISSAASGTLSHMNCMRYLYLRGRAGRSCRGTSQELQNCILALSSGENTKLP